MNELNQNQPPEVVAALTLKQQKENLESVRDLFARAHDFIAQANHPGHLGMKVAEVLNFLQFHYADFKLRAENMVKQIEAEAKAELSKVDVEAARAKALEALTVPGQTGGTLDAMIVPSEQPKA